ncbi:hypothetical protein CLOP_g24973 [Closterium sp. NIES-67]|nr:hypothetical protein CLOP_g24973 [Closterium sp. NIES-67]
MEGTCWYCNKVGHPWFKCFSRLEGWAPPGMKPPSGERAQGGAVQGSGAQGEGAQGNAYPGLFVMVEDVHGHEGDVGSVGKVVMHPLTHWVIDSGCTSHMTPQADLLDEVKPPGKIKYVAAASDELQQPSRQVEVAVSEEEISGVTEEGGAAEVEQQQQHESPPRVPQPPDHEQLEAAKRLVRYVSATASVGLEYSGVRQRLQRGAADVKSGEMLLSCYTDASFNSVKADGTSIGGYVCLLGGGAVSWRSKKQNEVGLSSCETEYMALHHGAKEVVWLRRLLEELGVGQEKPTVVFCDNESAPEGEIVV